MQLCSVVFKHKMHRGMRNRFANDWFCERPSDRPVMFNQSSEFGTWSESCVPILRFDIRNVQHTSRLGVRLFDHVAFLQSLCGRCCQTASSFQVSKNLAKGNFDGRFTRHDSRNDRSATSVGRYGPDHSDSRADTNAVLISGGSVAVKHYAKRIQRNADRSR